MNKLKLKHKYLKTEGAMKRVFTAIIILLLGVLVAGCSAPSSTVTTSPPALTPNTITATSNTIPAPTSTPTPTSTTTTAPANTVPAPTPGPDSLVIAADIFAGDMHQFGDIHMAPGKTFSVNLAYDETLKRVWNEPPEMTNEGVASKVEYKKGPAFQSWTYQAADDGVCMILFKTGGETIEVREWTFSLAVAVAPDSQQYFTGNHTMEQILFEGYDDVTDWDTMVMSYTEHDIFEAQGQLEGKTEGVFRLSADLKGVSPGWSRGIFTFTGTVGGKSGTLSGYAVSTFTGTLWNGKGESLTIYTSGTGELDNLRGISFLELSYYAWDKTKFPPPSKTIGTARNTMWFLP